MNNGEMNDFSTRGHIEIIWVPVHCGIAGNEMANELAKREHVNFRHRIMEK